ncbi:hypothetical protein RCL1_007631 [Eukaryota sp. TZLM3-RCL]
MTSSHIDSQDEATPLNNGINNTRPSPQTEASSSPFAIHVNFHDTQLANDLLGFVMAEDIDILRRSQSNRFLISPQLRQSPFYNLYESLFLNDRFPFVDLNEIESRADSIISHKPLSVLEFAQARFLYAYAAFNGNCRASNKLCVLKQENADLLPEFESFLKAQCELEDPFAMHILAIHFHSRKLYAEAFNLWKRAVDNQFILSFNRLGGCYSFAQGIEKNFRTAYQLVSTGVNNGDIAAMNDLAWYFVSGKVPQDIIHKAKSKALSLLSTALLHGFVYGFYHLGCIFLYNDVRPRGFDRFAQIDFARRCFVEGASRNSLACLRALLDFFPGVDQRQRDEWSRKVNELNGGDDDNHKSRTLDSLLAVPAEYYITLNPPVVVIEVDNSPKDDEIKAAFAKRRQNRQNNKL